MAKRGSITIKELHARTGAYVRQAAGARRPLPVTDRGKIVAALVSANISPTRRRRRTLLPEYAKFLKRRKSSNVVSDLDAVRADR